MVLSEGMNTLDCSDHNFYIYSVPEQGAAKISEVESHVGFNVQIIV